MKLLYKKKYSHLDQGKTLLELQQNKSFSKCILLLIIRLLKLNLDKQGMIQDLSLLLYKNSLRLNNISMSNSSQSNNKCFKRTIRNPHNNNMSILLDFNNTYKTRKKMTNQMLWKLKNNNNKAL